MITQMTASFTASGDSQFLMKVWTSGEAFGSTKW